MRFVRTLLASSLIGMLAVLPAGAASWCGKDDRENWKEFATTLWAGPQTEGDRPIIYVLGAPWCPFCAELFKRSQSSKYNFQIRFIPIDARSELHKEQIVSTILDGSDQGLTRMYIQRSPARGGFPQPQREFIDEVQTVTYQGLFDRFENRVKGWGSPIAFIMLNGNIEVIKGSPILDQLESLIPKLGRSDAKTPARRFLASIPKVERFSRAAAMTKQPNVRLRILPDNNALSVFCVPTSGQPMNVAGKVIVDGVEWLAFEQNAPKSKALIYARADEFTGFVSSR